MKIRTLILSMSLVFSFQAVAADLIGHTDQGSGSGSDPTYSTAYGYDAKTGGQEATAIGHETHAEGNRTTAVGNTSWATSEDSVAIGSYVNSNGSGTEGVPNGEQSVSIGHRVQATGYGAIAQGSNAQATGRFSTAMGAYTRASASFGVALGTNSESTRESGVSGYVPEGTTISDEEKSSATWTSTMGEASVGYTDGQGEHTRQVTHVAAGSQDTDAVNVAQLRAVNANVNADMQQLDQKFENRFNEQAHQFNNRIDNVEKDAQAGIAMAIATAGLPQAYLPGKSMFAVGAGTYRGEQGYAMGVSHITDGGH